MFHCCADAAQVLRLCCASVASVLGGWWAGGGGVARGMCVVCAQGVHENVCMCCAATGIRTASSKLLKTFYAAQQNLKKVLRGSVRGG